MDDPDFKKQYQEFVFDVLLRYSKREPAVLQHH